MTPWLALLAAAAAPLAGPDWSALADLQGRPLATPAAPSVVVVVGPRQARQLRAWEERLRLLRPRPPVLRVVDVPSSGRAEEIARTLRRRVPAGVVVALDEQRTVALSLGLDTGQPHVLVLDGTGRIVARIRGAADEAAAAAVRRAWGTAAGAEEQPIPPSPQDRP